MEFSVSNLGWMAHQDEEMADFLVDNGISNIDMVLGRYFNSSSELYEDRLAEIRDWWESRGIRIIGMQSLYLARRKVPSSLDLSKYPNILSSNTDIVNNTIITLMESVYAGSLLGVKNATFGSPKLRSADSHESYIYIATRGAMSLNRIATEAQAHGVRVNFEPNSVEYGCSYGTTIHSAADVVRGIGHMNLGLEFDIGSMIGSEMDIPGTYERYSGLVCHVHISEPGLAPLEERSEVGDAIGNMQYSGLPITVEVLASKDGTLDGIKRSISIAKSYLGR